MAYGLIGLYGIYLIFVGYKGNQTLLIQAIAADGPGFIPWLISVVVLGTMYRSDTLRPAVKPFIALAILAFVLKNWTQLASQFKLTVNAVSKPAGSTVTTTPVSTPTQQAAAATAGVQTSLTGSALMGGL